MCRLFAGLTALSARGDGGAVDHFNAREAAELQSEKEVGWPGEGRSGHNVCFSIQPSASAGRPNDLAVGNPS